MGESGVKSRLLPTNGLPSAPSCIGRIGGSPFAGANPRLGSILPDSHNSESTSSAFVPAIHNPGARLLRHRANRFAACFLLLILVNRPVRQALALDTLESSHRPLPIGNAKAGTIVIAELKFREIALQVLFAAESVGPAHTALEHPNRPVFAIRRAPPEACP